MFSFKGDISIAAYEIVFLEITCLNIGCEVIAGKAENFYALGFIKMLGGHELENYGQLGHYHFVKP